MKLEDFRPQRLNANAHTPRGMALLRDAIQQHGWIGAITVAADGETFDGSARLETLVEAGLDDPIVIDVDGSRPVIVRRQDIATADDPRARLLGLGANEIAHANYALDPAVLADAIADMPLMSDALATMIDDMAQRAGVVPGVVEPALQQEPTLKAECFVEIYCTSADLDEFRATLDEWAERRGVTVNIQG